MTQAVSWQALSHEAPNLQRNDLGSLRSPSYAPCTTTHPTSRHLTATQDTYYNRRVKFHKLLFASGVSAARLRR